MRAIPPPRPRWRATVARRLTGAPGERERGSASLELVVVFPVVLLLIFGGVQGALWYHARSVAMAAAQEGARAAGAEGGNPGAGEAAATAFLDSVGGSGVLTGAGVDVTRSATEATATVTGTAPTVLPGMGLAVAQSASVPVERLSR